MASFDEIYVPGELVEWKLPKEGTIKLNCDGGVSQVRGCAVGAGIFRDHQGTPVFSYACSNPEMMLHTSYQAEARSLRMGLSFALKLGFHKLWIEGDAKLLIEVVRSGRPNLWYEEEIIGSIRDLMGQFAREPMLTHIYREGNRAADSLVRLVRDNTSIGDDLKWELGDELPEKVAAIVDRERKGRTYLRKGCYIPRPKDCYFPPSTSQV